jgi:peroxiredoxin
MRLLALLAFALICPAAQTGPAVGSKVPDFDASDQHGAKHSLQSLMGPKGLMLVFFRSADW